MKKLTLTKRTIAKLDENQMAQVIGGKVIKADTMDCPRRTTSHVAVNR